MRAFVLSIAIALSSLLPRSADACSPPICWGGSFVPGDGATVPANVPALYWRPVENTFGGGKIGDPAMVRLYAAHAPNTSLAFTVQPTTFGDYLLVPSQPLTPGRTYVLEDGNTCQDNPGPRVAFVAGPEAPLPADLGFVQLADQSRLQRLELANDGGTCSVFVDAKTSSIELAPSAGAAPWMAMLFFETYVDGMRWYAATSINSQHPPGASWQGRGRDLLYRLCMPNQEVINEGVSAGAHAVSFRATLPGAGAVSVATTEQPFEIVCDGAGSGSGSGSGSGGGSGGGDDGSGGSTMEDGGCSTTGSTSVAVALVAWAVRRRRRRDRVIVRPAHSDPAV